MKDSEIQGPLTWTGLFALLCAMGLFLVVMMIGIHTSRNDVKPSYFEGVITGKQWVPAWEETDFITLYDAGTGITTMIPVSSTHHEEWRIFIGARWVRVPKDEFKKVEIGEEYSNRPKEEKP